MLDGALSEAEKIGYTYHSHTHKKHTHILVTTLSHATLYIHLTAQKNALTFRLGAGVIADNINYFSSPIACVMYALFASFAALLASRLTFR